MLIFQVRTDEPIIIRTSDGGKMTLKLMRNGNRWSLGFEGSKDIEVNRVDVDQSKYPEDYAK